MAQCILKYINDPQLMSKHSSAFKEYCIKNYNWDDIAKHFTTNVNLFLENKDFI